MSEKLNKIFGAELMQKLEQKVLADFLRGARWFGGKGRKIKAISILETVPIIIKDTSFTHLFILAVLYQAGSSERYFLPLSFVIKKRAIRTEKSVLRGIIANVKSGKEEWVIYDGAYNPELHRILLDMIAKRKRLKTKLGEFIFYTGKKFKSYLAEKTLPLESSVLKAEQSNTSIIYENKFILKLFRKLENGINPDAEIIKVLTEKVNFPYIPSFTGAIEYRIRNAEPIFVGLMQSFLANSRDAWTFTLENVNKYFKRVLTNRSKLTKNEKIPFLTLEKESLERYKFLNELVGEFYLKMVSLLGKRTAQLHLSLYSLSGEPDFDPEPFTMPYQKAVYQSMRTLLNQVFHVLEENADNFPKGLKPDVTEILAAKSEIQNRMAKILKKTLQAVKIRTHGDYHLGQVLFTGKDFAIIDFEGEPARSLSDRRLKRSPLRDVVGMVRSFHYAAYAGFLKLPLVRKEDKLFLKPWIKAWYHYVSSIFLASYLKEIGETSLLPKNREEFDILFQAYLLEKAVYELGYEVNNRPDWVVIPIKGIRYILKGS